METNGNNVTKTTQTQRGVTDMANMSENAQALVKAYKALTDGKRANSTDPDAEIDKELYMTIEETAETLKRSIYRVRQMYWEGKLGEGIKGAKKVYLLKKNVLDAKNLMESRKVKDSGVEQRRLGKRISLACETLTMLVKADKSILEPKRVEILVLVEKYARIGTELMNKGK